MSVLKAITIVLMLMTLPVAITDAQELVDGFAARTFRARSGTSLPYRLFVPDSDVRARRLPIVVYLHGVGGAGTDNLRQIMGGNRDGTHLWTEPSIQAQYLAFVVAPQIPSGSAWSAPGSALSPYAEGVLELLTHLGQEFAIDLNRVYLVGQSLGGFGVWDLVAKRPDFFAAAVPVCGGGDLTRIVAARRLPIWAFHGAQDRTVPVDHSRELAAALQAVGDSVKYTEYPDEGHDVWKRAFTEPLLPKWLFAQTRLRD